MQEAVITFTLGEAFQQNIVVNENQSRVTLGRSPDCNLIMEEKTVSARHGCFFWEHNRLFYADQNSTNGSFLNGRRITGTVPLEGGAVITLGGVHSNNKFTVALPAGTQSGQPVTSGTSSPQSPQGNPQGKQMLIAGRDPACDIILPQHNVSRFHAKLYFRDGRHYIEDNNSTNGTFVNGIRIARPCEITSRDTIHIASVRLCLRNGILAVDEEGGGLSVQLHDLSRTVPSGSGRKTILDHVSLSIESNEFVAVIGGSGAGKSTLMNILCGKTSTYEGLLTYNHSTAADSRSIFKSAIGFAPQNDVLYHDLTLYQMLYYSAKLKMPKDTKPEEYKNRVKQVIEKVALTGNENTIVRNLSGGQQKRASIAVELLSDPRLFFLDEPTSGLDPATERNLMRMLKGMAKNNKTIVVITHMTQNISLCDKLIVLGVGGKLCFFGPPSEALAYFGVTDFVDIYDQVNNNPIGWQQKFRKEHPVSRENGGTGNQGTKSAKKNVKSGFTPGWSQFLILSSRYLRLIYGDKKRLLLLLLQAPILGVLLMLVSGSSADGSVFEYSSTAKSTLFALSCAAFWVGMLNSIQEICKERAIFEREKMSTIRLFPYISSKILVIGLICVFQSFVLTLITHWLSGGGFLENSLGVPPFWGYFVTTCLTTVCAACLGLAISCMSLNADRAMAVAPIVLLPQILFSGVAFELTGFMNFISSIIPCKLSMQNYGVLTNFNALPTSSDVPEKSLNAMYSVTNSANLYGPWVGLCLISLVFIGVFAVALKIKNYD